MLLQRVICVVGLAIGAVGAATGQQRPAGVIEMTAAGDIQIGPDGHVTDYQLKSKLSPAVAQLVDRSVRAWRFEPIVIDGRPVIAKTTLSIRLRGEPASGDTYSLHIADVHFGTLTRARQKAPEYPGEAVRVGLGARVELYLVIDANGKVVEATPRQTSLSLRAKTELEAETWRRRFERASVEAAKRWRYDPSEFIDGKPVANRRAIAPIEFRMHNAHSGWTAYVPGPVHAAPWGANSDHGEDEQQFAQLTNSETASMSSRFRLAEDVVGKTL